MVSVRGIGEYSRVSVRAGLCLKKKKKWYRTRLVLWRSSLCSYTLHVHLMWQSKTSVFLLHVQKKENVKLLFSAERARPSIDLPVFNPIWVWGPERAILNAYDALVLLIRASGHKKRSDDLETSSKKNGLYREVSASTWLLQVSSASSHLSALLPLSSAQSGGDWPRSRGTAHYKRSKQTKRTHKRHGLECNGQFAVFEALISIKSKHNHP